MGVPSAWRSLRDASEHPPLRRPTVLQFPVNDICNSRCQMCSIWKQRKADELSPNDVRTILGDDVFSDLRGVGINGGEPTLRRDLGELVTAIVETLPRLEAISLITNAIRDGPTLDRIRDVRAACDRKDIKLDVMVSLDGIGAVHDRVRGVAGNFESAAKLLRHLRDHDECDTLRIGCTIIRENAFQVEEVLDWAIREGIYARFRVGVPHPRLYNENQVSDFALTPEHRSHVANFLNQLVDDYEPEQGRKDFYRSLRDQLAYGAPRKAGCVWRNRGATLLADGGLGYCAVASPRLGDARHQSPSELYWGNVDTLQEIRRTACDKCMHDYDGSRGVKHLVKRRVIRNTMEMKEPIPTFVRHANSARKAAGEAIRVRRAAKLLNAPQQGRTNVPSHHYLIIGWYGTETLGDKLILLSIIQALQEQDASAQIEVASLEPYVTWQTLQQLPINHGATVVTVPEAKARAEKGFYTSVIFGGGPLMAPVAPIVDMAEIMAANRQAGGRNIVAGCGVGPLGIPRRDAAARAILDGADHVLLRDEASRRRAEDFLNTRTDCYHVAPDPAAHSARLWAPENSRAAGRESCLLALRRWPLEEYNSGNYDPVQRHQQFQDSLRAFVSARLATGSERVVPFAMHKLWTGGDDRWFYRQTFRGMPEILQALDNRQRPVQQELQHFSDADRILAMRFHSVVIAAALDKSFVAIDYTFGGKVRGVLEDAGELARIVTSDGLDANHLISQIDQARPFMRGERMATAAWQGTQAAVSVAVNDAK